MTRALLEQAAKLLTRYRDEVPLGNKPHMIAHKTDELLEAIRTHLAQPVQPQGEPAWHDAPTVPGDWVIVCKGFKSELQTGITQQEIDSGSSWPGHWYGPIPPAPQEPAP